MAGSLSMDETHIDSLTLSAEIATGTVRAVLGRSNPS
jgi:hypothetical protein